VTEPPRLLLVEDEPALAAVLARQLVHAGYDVEACSSAARALGSLRTSTPPFALAVVDLTLPDASGSDLVRQLLETAPSIGLVIASGLPFDPQSIPHTRPNQIRFLQKPFRAQALIEVLAAVAA
jgi:DNA-binding NtrC family response regulator